MKYEDELTCRPGDVARIHGMGSFMGLQLEDKLVRLRDLVREGSDWWELEEAVVVTNREGSEILMLHIQDQYLFPIRYLPGEDEMLRLAGKPQQLGGTPA